MGAMTRCRALLALAGVLLGLLVAVVSPAGPASAHAALLETQPQAGTVLAQSPGEVVLTFSEQVRIVAGRIHVIGPDGKVADAGKPSVTNTKLRIPLKPVSDRGTYLVSYRVISADSHPIAGGFSYSVGAPSSTAPQPGTEGTRTDPAVSTLLAVVRYLGYAGLVLIVGPGLFLAVLWPRRLGRRGPARLWRPGSARSPCPPWPSCTWRRPTTRAPACSGPARRICATCSAASSARRTWSASASSRR